MQLDHFSYLPGMFYFQAHFHLISLAMHPPLGKSLSSNTKNNKGEFYIYHCRLYIYQYSPSYNRLSSKSVDCPL